MTQHNRVRIALLTLALAFGSASLGFPGPAVAQAPATDDHHPPAPAGNRSPGGMPMMQGGMPQTMPMMQGMPPIGMPMGGMPMARHVEGRIAFLKAELRITDAQAPAWNAFADVLRNQATNLRTVMHDAMQAGDTPTGPDRIQQQIAMLGVRLDAMKATLAALKPLYAELSDEQKKAFDGLLAEHMMGMGGHP
ncbi:MAG: Spy/CpxP family protein refolding chaperone [Acetobacteraceae bacterium]|nr:Spy/CpxP family protein refolding chaperone [Acetobacteraceae bacterium]